MKRLLAFAFLAAALATPAFSAEAQLAVGGEGELYRVQAGSYGALFTAGALPAETPVLALDIERPGEALERLLVPGTEGEEEESSPALVLESTTDSLFLVWESRINSIHFRLNLGSYAAGAWSEPIEVSGNVYAAKSSPRLAVSRDAYEIITERHRCGSIVITSNRGPDEWLGMFADPMRAQSAIDRFTGNAYDLVIEGESYRQRLKPAVKRGKPPRSGQPSAP